MECELFEVKKKTSDGNVIKKYYYTYKDPSTKRRKTRVCKNCSTLDDAKLFLKKVKIANQNQYLIRHIAYDMFLEDSEHLKRLKLLGKSICEKTRKQKRKYIELIIYTFGDKYLDKLKISEIQQYLIDDDEHSGSWKNSYLEAFSAIYDETIWKCNRPIPRPDFQRFSRNSKKADVFTTDELLKFFNYDYWKNYDKQYYLLFLCCISCGLRLGESIGLRAKQFIFNENVLVIDGFIRYDDVRTDYNKTGSEEEKKWRVVPLPDTTATFIKNYLLTKKINDNDLIFKLHNKCIRQDVSRKVFNMVLENCGVEKNDRKLVPHSLRYTYITRMRRDCSAEDVKKLAGHSNIQMTDYYTRVVIDELIQNIKTTIPAANRLFL